MAKYNISRPLQEVRLRNWPGGRVGAMKLMISRLEDALNDTLAAQVTQDVARVVSLQVPFIIQFNVEPGYRLFKVNFPVPPGLTNLLFYEIQHDDNSAFTSPTTLRTPQNDMIIAGVGFGETRYFRARVVNTSFEASIWTATFAATSAQSKVAITSIADVDTQLIERVGVWQTITEFNYTPTGGAVSIMAQVGLCGVNIAKSDDSTPRKDEGNGIVISQSHNKEQQILPAFGPAHCQFRWLIDGKQRRFPRHMLSSRPWADDVRSVSSEDGGSHSVMDVGHFSTPFFRPENPINVKLQAAKGIGCEWRQGFWSDSSASRGLYISNEMTDTDPFVRVKLFQVIEVQEEF